MMKKLITIIIAASLALTIQAQDITNTLGTDGNFFVNKLGGSPSFLTLSSTADHTIQFSTASSGLTFKGSGGDAVFAFDESHAIAALTMATIGHADANWLGNNFSHLQLQSENSSIHNKFSMVGRNAINYFNAYSAGGTGASPTSSLDNHGLLIINAFGYQDGNNRLAATIHFTVDGTPAGNYVPGKIQFSTSTSSTGNTFRMTIRNDGKVGIGTETPTSTLEVGGSMSLSYASGGDITLDETHYVYAADGGSTITLPTAVGITGRVYIIKSTAGVVTINSSNNENIDISGTTSYSLTAQGKYVRLMSNGAAWLIIGQN